jgi:pre-mRNA-processing factor 8
VRHILTSSQLPKHLPTHEYLNNLEPLGIIHTSSGNDAPYMTSADVIQHSRLMNTHSSWDSKTVSIQVCFTPGSVSLASWALTPNGYKWGAQAMDVISDNPEGFSTSFGEKTQVLLSDKIRGYFLVPDSGVWNYTNLGPTFDSISKKPVHVKLDVPARFYDSIHRPGHFASFAELEDAGFDRDNLHE